MDAGNNLVVEKPYKLRKLQACDIIPLAKIIGKIGIDEIAACYADEDFTELMLKLKNRREAVNGAGISDGHPTVDGNIRSFGDNTEESGDNTDAFVIGVAVATRIANQLLLKLDCCMKEVFDFLGSLSGLSGDEVGHMDLDIFLQMVIDVITENNMVNFIKAAMKFIE